MNLNICFKEGELFKLTNEAFQDLKQNGRVITEYAPAKDYNISEKEYAKTILAYDASLSNSFFEFEPSKDIELFIANSFVVSFYPKTGMLELIPSISKPLINLLPAISENIATVKLIKKNKQSLEFIFLDPLFEIKSDILLATGNLKDVIACCECGEPGCSSEYIWAEHYTGLASFSIVESKLVEVCLFPFRFI